MSKVYEVGHAKNVARFSELTGFCKSYGSDYNPSKATIQIPNLDIIINDGKAAIADVTDKLVAFANATNQRQNIFEPLKKLSTRLLGAFTVTNAPDNAINDMRSINKKIQGTRITKKTIIVAAPSTDETNLSTPDEKTISTSQRSYDQQIEHFAKAIALLKTEPSYAPNEVELQISSLEDLLHLMRTASEAVTNAYIKLSNSRIKRNEVLYKKDTGLCHVAQEVKKYVKSVFGATSPQCKQINGIRFSIK